ncbi:hypothetical protein SNE40_021739 [Patella caerulea]|uniref:Serpin domain-containing protein n=1 Tax=Patella caerulea TaxID=87958 RepID=A0AAN8GBL9_PATCE
MKMLLVLGLAVLALSYEVNGGVNRRALSNTQMMQQLSTATSKFSFDLYNKFTPTNKNLIISPFSVFTALAMTSLGSKGQTTDEIYKALNIESLGDDVHHAFQYYTSLLQGLTNVTLNNANGMFVRPGTQLLSDFSNKMKTYYDAKAQEFDFSNPKGPEAPINDWVSKQTAGMIKDFLAPGSIDGSTVMWLINAIYFQGTWKSVFDERLTRKQKFHIDSTTSVDVDMMSVHEQMFNYKRLGNLKTTVMELPYVGDRYSMFILLPDAIEGLAALESGLDAQALDSAIQNLDQRRFFTLAMPKVKIESELQLKKSLNLLGVQDLFDPLSSDLSGITGDLGLFVDEAIQKAVIEINERGTKAAAVTGFGIKALAIIQTQHVTINHPYMFVLRDTVTGVNLFHGRYTDPRE